MEVNIFVLLNNFNEFFYFNINPYFFLIFQFLKKLFVLCQVPTKDDDEFCNIWQSLQGSGKVQHFQPTLQEKVSIPCLIDI